MKNELQDFYLDRIEPNRSCLLALRDIILDFDPNISEAFKWKMPCFCFKNRMFCFLWEDSKTNEPYLLFVEGKHLNHPELEVGNRSRMKIMRINPNLELPMDAIQSVITDAVNLYKNGVIKIK